MRVSHVGAGPMRLLNAQVQERGLEPGTEPWAEGVPLGSPPTPGLHHVPRSSGCFCPAARLPASVSGVASGRGHAPEAMPRMAIRWQQKLRSASTLAPREVSPSGRVWEEGPSGCCTRQASLGFSAAAMHLPAGVSSGAWVPHLPCGQLGRSVMAWPLHMRSTYAPASRGLRVGKPHLLRGPWLPTATFVL